MQALGAMQLPKITPLDSARFGIADFDWPFARERRADIDAHFAARQAKTPELWNGRVLLLHNHVFKDRALAGAFFETDFASFIAWRDFGFPEAGVVNCFSMAALRSSDGAWLLGVMAPHTANPGRTYFPAGTPDPEDVSDGEVDLAANVLREVTEETGLVPADFHVEDGWTAVETGARIALMKVLQARQPADVLRARILDFLAGETQPELAGIHIVRDRADFTAAMPDFVTAFLAQRLPR
jgi:8-oxo-dGTP pyrophosphatase MutT (NUDIX family)